MTSSRSSRRSLETPVIEALEERRLLSADLTGLFSGATPGTLQSADKNHAAVRLMNDGDSADRGTVSVDLFAAGADGTDVYLSSAVKNVNLKPGRGAAVKFKFAEPGDLADGTYSLMAQINPGTTTDGDPSNDLVIAPAPITARQPFVDLAMKTVQAPATPIVINGASVHGIPASAKFSNDGTALARGEDTVNFYLSANSKLDGSDILVGSMNDGMITLKPGHSSTVKAELQPPVNTPDGNYFLIAKVTPGGAVVQKNTADQVGIAGRQVQVVVIKPVIVSGTTTVSQPSIDTQPIGCVTGTTDSGTTDDSSASDDSQPVCNPPSDCPPGTDDNCDSSSDDGSQSDDCGPSQDDQSSDDSDSQGDTSDDSSSDSQSDSSQDDSNQSSDNSDSSDTSTDDSGDTSSGDDSGSDVSDDYSNSSSDDSGDDSGDYSSDDSGDDSADYSSDDSGDDSSDYSSDDSGDDSFESDDIFRRSNSASHASNNVLHHPASTPKRAAGYNTQRHLISGGHK